MAPASRIALSGCSKIKSRTTVPRVNFEERIKSIRGFSPQHNEPVRGRIRPGG